ncbi:hypothetical protein SAMN05444157_2179 [Frankineae bacterium MT45]|nr:hypothetical protein SAMN05444157_2179 [Frankineae bacterium MT45]
MTFFNSPDGETRTADEIVDDGRDEAPTATFNPVAADPASAVDDTFDSSIDDDIDEDFAPRAKERLGALSIALIALLIAGVGFLGGVITQKHSGSSTTRTAAGGNAARFGALREGAAGGLFGGTGGTGAGGGTGTGAGGATTGGTDSGTSDTPAVIGTIVSITGDTAVVKNLAGKEVTVHLSSDTRVLKSATPADLKAGQIVTVAGSTGTDGSVAATSVTAK